MYIFTINLNQVIQGIGRAGTINILRRVNKHLTYTEIKHVICLAFHNKSVELIDTRKEITEKLMILRFILLTKVILII